MTESDDLESDDLGVIGQAARSITDSLVRNGQAFREGLGPRQSQIRDEVSQACG